MSVESARSVRELRKAIGMNSQQLASRVGKSGGAIRHLEKAESTGTANLQNLKELADALGYELEIVYRKTDRAERLVVERAEEKAEALVQRILATMALERQELKPEDAKQMRERLVNRYLQQPKALWS